ncbi:uncharacterized protein LOC132285593 [Cornus florida]|uniref:uncharacterized protein LOC132285593 n=1 Tax=Cornus florida TaxID=4283 RepID=UPI00289AEEB2|nr:uncharacterized protein LOC132285593 [Cornus florida]
MATEEGDFSRRDVELNEEMVEMLSVKRRCCFCIPCFGSDRSRTVGLNWWQKVRTADDEKGWWTRGISAVKKIRQWSEIVAGPKWKTFIRRFNRSKSGGSRNAKFQYDPLSYSLNFDEGPGQNGNSVDEEVYGFRNFSSRFASVPMSAKSSMDLGKEAPAFS